MQRNKMVICCILPILIAIAAFFVSCSEIPEGAPIYLSGSVDTQNQNWPTFVIISKDRQIENIDNIPQEAFVDIIETDIYDKTFGIELSDKGMSPGDGVIVFAFIDKDYIGGIPEPGQGDLVGLYYDKDNLTPSYLLISGNNNNVHIKLNRMVFSFDAQISGIISDPNPGELTLIAYAGDIVSSDYRKFDPDYVIGYEQIDKTTASVAFSMEVWPYLPCGQTLPIQHVYIFALLDIDQNGKIDEGDRIGYYKINEKDWPGSITVEEGNNRLEQAVALPIEIKNNDSNIQLKGSITFPSNYDISLDPGPLYVLVADADEYDANEDDPYSSIKYFQQITPDNTDFDFDLSDTGLSPGDDIYIFSMWDRDYQGGAPELSDNDFLGSYLNMDSLSARHTLVGGINEGIHLSCSRVYDSEPDTSISGIVTGDKTGDVIIFAYAGEITSSDFTKLDQDALIGFQSFSKEERDVPFEMKLYYRPFEYKYPIGKVYIGAWLDAKKNGEAPNGKIDAGDMTGYLKQDNNLPKTITIYQRQDNFISESIELTTELKQTSSYDVSLKGSIVLPTEYYYTDARPIYIVISQADTFDADNPISSIRFFQKLSQGQTDFNFDLSKTGLGPGDEIMVYAFWDLDYEGDLPMPTAGDMIGLYQNKILYQFSVILNEGVNYLDPANFWDFRLNKIVYIHNAFIKFTLQEGSLPDWIKDDDGDGSRLDEGDQIFVLAVHKDGVGEYWDDESWIYQFTDGDIGLEPQTITGLPDLDYVIGMTTVRVGIDADASGTYTMNILPMIYEDIPVLIDPFRIEDVYLFAVFDHDGDGAEIFEMMGYFSRLYDASLNIYVPDSFDINDNDEEDGTSLNEPVPVRFSNHNVVGWFHKMLVYILQILEELLNLDET